MTTQKLKKKTLFYIYKKKARMGSGHWPLTQNKQKGPRAVRTSPSPANKCVCVCVCVALCSSILWVFFILQTRFNTHLYTHTQLWAKANRINSLFSFFFFLFIAERERETIGAILLLISFLRLHSRRFSLFLLRPCSSVTTFAGKPSPEVKVSNFFDCWRVITSFVMNLSAYSIQSS